MRFIPVLVPLALCTLAATAPTAQAAPKAHISMIDTETGAVRTVRSAPNPEVFYTGPVWAADARSVYVLREKYTIEGADVLRISTATGKSTQLDRFRGAEYAELSAAHDRVAYSTDPSDEGGVPDTVRIAPVGTGAGVKRTLPGEDVVTDLSFSPDDRLLAVGHTDPESKQASITIYDTATLTEVRTVQTNFAVFDDDSWSADSSALYYRAATDAVGREFVRLTVGDGALQTITTSPFEDVDGHAVASNGVAALVARRTVSLYPDGPSFRVPRRNHFGGGIDFSADGADLAYAYTRNGRELGRARVNVRDAISGELQQSVSAGDGEPISLSYSPDGRRIVVLVALRQVDY